MKIKNTIVQTSHITYNIQCIFKDILFIHLIAMNKNTNIYKYSTLFRFSLGFKLFYQGI